MDNTQKILKHILKEQKEFKKALKSQDKKIDAQGDSFKKWIKEQREEFQQYLGSVIEHSDTNFKIIAEQYEDIKNKLDRHERILNSHSEILEKHSMILDSHTKTLDSHTKTLDSHTEMIASIKEDVEVMKIDIKDIKRELVRKTDIERFEILENRTAVLEARVKRLKLGDV